VTATGRTWGGWGVREGPFGIRLFDVGVVALVIVAIEVNVVTGGGPGAVPLNAWAYLFGALLAVPILFRHRWPLRVLIASAVVRSFYYIFARRNISPPPVFFVPLYDAAVVGYLALAIAIPAVFMVIGLFVVEVSVRQGIAALSAGIPVPDRDPRARRPARRGGAQPPGAGGGSGQAAPAGAGGTDPPRPAGRSRRNGCASPAAGRPRRRPRRRAAPQRDQGRHLRVHRHRPG